MLSQFLVTQCGPEHDVHIPVLLSCFCSGAKRKRSLQLQCESHLPKHLQSSRRKRQGAGCSGMSRAWDEGRLYNVSDAVLKMVVFRLKELFRFCVSAEKSLELL